MQQLCKAILSAAIATACLSAHAQTPDLPSAPLAPTPANPAKPSFALPPPTMTPPKGTLPDPKKEAVCYAPPGGIYTKENQNVPAALKGEVGSYMRLIFAEIFNDWDHHMSVTEKNSWGKGKLVAVRFAIFPNGSYDPPIVTVSSGKEVYDNHALDAVNSHASFPPLPKGIEKPLPICLKIGYHLDESDWAPETPEWMRPATQKQP